ncbi:MAG: bifunctional DNA-formamidopyrimidine glycosylase/DNA-(apurinic or apyrimidinic site) lyase [Chloroflexi bacterium]|nr:bifunctional DNA-formamidopyrimidine glycosylase/DNA-(apurinic or apyrimidinic site) lyase [Chloroflexota bacterium]
MPELPEVEITVRGLAALLPGRRIASVSQLDWERMLGGAPAAAFAAALTGATVTGVDRRAKLVIVRLDGDRALIIHRKMTGNLLYYPEPTPPAPHTHAVLHFADGAEVHYVDPRKFGRLRFCADPTATAAVLMGLGPEPLGPDLTADALGAQLARRGIPIKTALLDQGVIAGLGNIYADEALFLAGIHPLTPANALTPAARDRLIVAIRQVLTEAIGEGGTTFSAHRGALGEAGAYWERRRVYQRAGWPCPVCGTPIVRQVLGQRSTHFCPTCQPSR